MWFIWWVEEATVAGPGAARVSGRVWAARWGSGREGQGRAQDRGLWGWVRLRCVGVRVRLQRHAGLVSCRPGILEEKLAVCCSRGKDSADECRWWEEGTVGVG